MSKNELPPVPEELPAPAVDSHTHLDACGAHSAAEVSTVLDRAQRAGISRVLTVSDDLEAAKWAVEASTWDYRVFAAVAIHPTHTNFFDDFSKSEVERLIHADRVVAVGETGLDYYWPHFDEHAASPEAQRDAFRWHIDLAKRFSLPLMIHDRDAHEDVLRILDEEKPPETVVFHCFSGDAEMARRCVEAGYVLSFAGTVTFRNARDLHAAAQLVPVGQFLVETDAPYLTPHPFRGRPNEPYCAAYTVRGIAELRGWSLAGTAEAAGRNAERVFRLPAVTAG